MVITISRRLAAIGLVLLAAGAAAIVVWGVTDILATFAAFAACTSPLPFYTHNFMHTGGVAVCLLPLLAVSRNERFHKILMGVFVVTFIGLPIATFVVVNQVMEDRGYVVASGYWSVIARDVAELEAVACTPTSTAERTGPVP